MACGSTAVLPVLEWGRELRWIALAGLAVVALAYAREAPRRPLEAPVAVAAAFVLLALGSAAWSVEPRITLGRAAAFAVVLVIAAALARGTGGRPDAVAGFLVAIVAGAAIVAALGLVALAANPDDAILRGFRGEGFRWRGFGENPNTVPVLAALALPAALWLALRPGSRAQRIAAAIAGAGLFATIVAADSRAAFAASFLGLSVVALAAVGDRRTRVLVMAGLVAVYLGGFAVGRIPDPPADRPATLTTLNEDVQGLPTDLACVLLPRDQAGRPPCGQRVPPRSREVFGDSGRFAAWRGGVEQAMERPVAGFGFGAEDEVFVDRWFSFFGDVPESSFVGMLLQLGVAGLVAFGALLAALLAGAPAVLRRDRAGPGAACLGVVAAGIALAVFQSYAYVAGNVGTLTFWLGAFLLAAAAGRAQGATIIAARDGNDR